MQFFNNYTKSRFFVQRKKTASAENFSKLAYLSPLPIKSCNETKLRVCWLYFGLNEIERELGAILKRLCWHTHRSNCFTPVSDSWAGSVYYHYLFLFQLISFGGYPRRSVSISPSNFLPEFKTHIYIFTFEKTAWSLLDCRQRIATKQISLRPLIGWTHTLHYLLSFTKMAKYFHEFDGLYNVMVSGKRNKID